MIVVLGRENCAYCDMTCDALDEKGVDYLYKDISIEDGLQDFVKYDLKKHTVPVVIKVIGGWNELENYLENEHE